MFCHNREKNTYESLHSNSAPWPMAIRYRRKTLSFFGNFFAD